MLNHGIVPASGGDYEIDNSLRFNDNDSAYLSRTPSSAGNRKTWTWSGWVKRGNLSGSSYPRLFSTEGSSACHLNFMTDDTLRFEGAAGLITSQVFRDVSSWYHIVLAFDTTQGTATDRVKLYINGTQITAFGTTNYPSLNEERGVNNTVVHNIGRDGSEYLDGYLAEVNFVDGQALTPADFGETGDYGEWKPTKYTGTYGTNGFYLDFENSGSLGTDASSNSNNWTPNNLSATDQMLDSPTNNFCTLNPLDTIGTTTISEGSLKGVAGSSGEVRGTFGMESGKWYWEFYTVDGSYVQLGIGDQTASGQAKLTSNNGVTYYSQNGKKYLPAGNSSYGASYTNGDIIGVALNMDTNTLTYYKNNVSQGDITVPSNTIYVPVLTREGTSIGIFNFGQDSSFAGNKTAQGNSDGGGIGDFYYTPPSGYLALCTQNLPEPTVVPSEHFNTVLYSGNGSTQSITGVGFQPDWTWVKGRSATEFHYLWDVVRGVGESLYSDLTDAENTDNKVTSFDSDGFSVSASGHTNASSVTYVAWNWKANGSGGTGHTQGTITSTVSANQDAGFSIVSWVGTETNSTIGHGLSKAPEMMILKGRETTEPWFVYHTGTGNTSRMQLNSNTTPYASVQYWNNTTPASSVFTVGINDGTNDLNNEMIAYCFHSVDGYSKVGSYTGNGSSSDGPFVYTGFRPAMVIRKRSTGATGHWYITDNERDGFNGDSSNDTLFADATNTELEAGRIDLLSNGFKVRTNDGQVNASGGEYIYIAFAETPFSKSNAR